MPTWFSEPAKWSNDNGSLNVFTDDKKDFWQKTYYKPDVSNDNAHLYYEKRTDENLIVTVRFCMQPQQQFDQAGVVLRYDTQHWVKAGIEYVDGGSRLSCVVTNTHSDWSTQSYAGGPTLGIRLQKLGTDVVVEYDTSANPAQPKWEFTRIAHFHDVANDQEVMVGPYACSPTKGGMLVTFSEFGVRAGSDFAHTAGEEK
eukprot:m.13418 g.13418  ORF g.13418 m.13418 type:complete len:200 (+) comp7392_c0_seq1:552-1151(+)